MSGFNGGFGVIKGADGLDKLIKHLKGDDGVVERTIPIKKEWQVQMEKMLNMEKVAKAAVERFEKEKRKFWATIEMELDMFDRNMRFNKKKMEIEVMKEEEDDEDED